MIAGDIAALATPVDKLTMLPGNPRRGDVGAVARSLERFGQLKPIVATLDGTVVAGNHTLAAALELGWDEIAVNWADLDEATAKAYALADNRTAELGGYDDVDLAALLAEVHDIDPALFADTGWTDDDLATLIARTTPRPTIAEPDEVPDTAPAKTILGDTWLLGRHRLRCGDATVPTELEALMAGERADLVWTDPPYGVAYVGKTADALTIENDRLDAGALEGLIRAAFANAITVCQPGAGWFAAVPPGPLQTTFATVMLALDLLHQQIIWVKDVFVMGRSDYHYRHEPILYGWTPGATHRLPPDRTQDTVWEIPRPKRSEEHPTMKPVALITRAIENHTDPGAIVLDPFAGSGSTLIAAEMTGRAARVLELDPHYCDVVCKRYQLATGIMPVAEATGVEHDFCEDDG